MTKSELEQENASLREALEEARDLIDEAIGLEVADDDDDEDDDDESTRRKPNRR